MYNMKYNKFKEGNIFTIIDDLRMIIVLKK